MHNSDNPTIEITQIVLTGEIVQVVFYAQDTGYGIFKVQTDQAKIPVAVVGHAPTLHQGQHIKAQGHWIQNRQYGKQFKAESIALSLPTNTKALEQYLASGLIKGIGSKTAAKLVAHFSDNLVEVIQNDYKKLSQVQGISPAKAKKIHQAWQSQQSINDIMLFLHSHGIGIVRAIRIYKTYGEHAIAKIQENPYRLCQDMHGIGFKTADQLALSLGFNNDNRFRIQYGILHSLNEHNQLGHSAIAYQDLIQKTASLLDIAESNTSEVIDDLITQNTITLAHIDNNKYIYPKRLYEAEQQVAQALINLLNQPSNLPQTNTLIEKLQQTSNRTGHQLSTSQHNALRTILSNKVVILTGGPGVGKTTLVKSLAHILRSAHVIMHIMAPTGRAAKRLKESTSMEAKTIHRTLAIDPITKKFQHNHTNPLKTEYCIVDESSMLDLSLFAQLLNALPVHCGLLLVGDIDQLPSVGPGTILKDLIEFKRIPTIALTEIFRQAQTSWIIQYAHMVRQGKLPDFNYEAEKLKDCYFIAITEEDKCLTTITQLIKERIPKRFAISNHHDMQILTPMRRGPFGTERLNTHLQESLNPEQKSLVKHGHTQYRLGDKVMQIRNNYDKDVFNGDIGLITDINNSAQSLVVLYEEKAVSYYFDELDELTLAYAMTIHKSQGSEFPVVIMPIFTSHYMMLQRNLVYTGMTRSKQLLIIIGQKKALHMAVNDQRQLERIGFLTEQLEQTHKNLIAD